MLRSYLRLSLLVLLTSSCSLIVDKLESSGEPGEATIDASANDATATIDSGQPPIEIDGALNLLDGGPAVCDGITPNGACYISCTTSTCGGGPIVCPIDIPCIVNCTGEFACEDTAIDCSLASSCDILCKGTDACDTGGITCGGTDCRVLCQGSAACEEGVIECNANSCDIGCVGVDACAAGVCCQGVGCGDGSHSCTTVGNDNCNCPD